MTARELERLLGEAETQHRLANERGAIDLVKRALSLDPDHARAHAVLANILIDARRLPGAAIEIQLALHLDAHDPYIHHIAARVHTAERKLDDAWAHCLISLEELDVPAGYYVLAAQIQQLRGDPARARELLGQALASSPAHTQALTALARLELGDGALDACGRLVEQALESDPADLGAHVLAGELALRTADVAGAERHARFVLGQRAMDRGGLTLWASIQARRSKLLGAWWRWSSYQATRSETQRIAGALLSFVLVRVLVIVTDELGHEAIARIISWAWLAFCAYTWIAPALFRRMLEKSLGTVTLDPNF
ncbi:MAG TPA: tetratricopeptide repeat protein [Kofleriaceae bacterium]